MTFPPNKGPIAPERNPAIHPNYYKPSVFDISNLSLGITTLVTTAVNHNYVVGQQVRLLVPAFYGTFQITGQDGFVMSIPNPNQVIVNINSVGYNAFISNPAYGPTPPQILAIGDVNTGNIIPTGRSITMGQTAIPGAFENISPCPVGTFV